MNYILKKIYGSWFFILFWLIPATLFGNENGPVSINCSVENPLPEISHQRDIQIINSVHIKNSLLLRDTSVHKSKLAALALTLLTGIVGGHRIYLGTHPLIPVVYALTLGGGVGILPFIDLIVLAFSKDIDRFANNNKIFMWM